MADKLNPMEETVQYAAEVYVELVNELLEELAPYRPWWSKKLSKDEALWRWEEVREPIVTWLVRAGIFMGFRTYGEVLDNLEDFWIGHLLVDMVPPEVIDTLPLQLIELVQAGPYEAADHIRMVEKEYAKRTAARNVVPSKSIVGNLSHSPGGAGEGRAGEVAESAPA